MIKINTLLLTLAPAALFAQEAAVSYKLNAGGIVFMSLAWASIIIWNIVCFMRILKNHK